MRQKTELGDNIKKLVTITKKKTLEKKSPKITPPPKETGKDIE